MVKFRVAPIKVEQSLIEHAYLLFKYLKVVAPKRCQRPLCWTNSDKTKFFESILMNRVEGTFIFIDIETAFEAIKREYQSNEKSYKFFEDLLKCKVIENLEIIDSEIIGIEFILSIRKNKNKKQIIRSKERRLNLTKKSLISYVSDLTIKNKNIFFGEESYIKKIKYQLIKSIFPLLRKILRKTLSKNKYQSLKIIYQKLKKYYFK